MKEKHTPGPWAATPTAVVGVDRWIVTTADLSQKIGVVDGGANAELCVAAPGMFTALEKIRDVAARWDQRDAKGQILDLVAAVLNGEKGGV